MATAEEQMASYRAIQGKLKKRFMRKPDLDGANEQFQALANAVLREGVPAFAAFCWMAAARCDEAMGKPTAEAESFVHAAQLFMSAESAETLDDEHGFSAHLIDAIHCYDIAIDIYIRAHRTALAATLNAELGNALLALRHSEQACHYFVNAARLLSDQSPLAALDALNRALDVKIRMFAHDEALDIIKDILAVVTSVTGIESERLAASSDLFHELASACPPGAYRDLLAQCEITSVLLLLLVPASRRSQRPELEALWTRYSTPSFTMPQTHVEANVFLNLQSVVLAVQNVDIEAIHNLQSELWADLSCTQNDLYSRIPGQLH